MFIQPTSNDLGQMLGKTIAEICPCGYVDPGFNHCAHFVSHVSHYQFGYTCFAQTGSGNSEDRACIRVVDLFPRCRSVGNWADRPATVRSGLVFVTDRGNVHVRTRTIDNVRKKHVGYFIGETVWHYSNKEGKVITQTPEQYSHHYPGNSIGLFYGEYPI